jgi:hypothetical protein
VGFEQCNKQAVIKLSLGCKKFKRVHLMSRDLEEGCLVALVRANPGLQTLRFRAVGVTEWYLFGALEEKCRNLTELYLEDGVLGDDNVRQMFKKCKRLRSLTLHNCTIQYVENEYRTRTTSDTMRSLVLDHTNISTGQVEHLLYACSQLTSLTLRYTEDFFDDEYPSLRSLRNLEELIIRGAECSYPEDILQDLFSCRAKLRVLDVGNAVVLRNNGLNWGWFPQLQRVNMSTSS